MWTQLALNQLWVENIWGKIVCVLTMCRLCMIIPGTTKNSAHLHSISIVLQHLLML